MSGMRVGFDELDASVYCWQVRNYPKVSAMKPLGCFWPRLMNHCANIVLAEVSQSIDGFALAPFGHERQSCKHNLELLHDVDQWDSLCWCPERSELNPQLSRDGTWPFLDHMEVCLNYCSEDRGS